MKYLIFFCVVVVLCGSASGEISEVSLRPQNTQIKDIKEITTTTTLKTLDTKIKSVNLAIWQYGLILMGLIAIFTITLIKVFTVIEPHITKFVIK
jgi:hypothetical protein